MNDSESEFGMKHKIVDNLTLMREIVYICGFSLTVAMHPKSTLVIVFRFKFVPFLTVTWRPVTQV